MNIIINKDEHLFLQSLVFRTITIGSYLYGSNSENSDIDKLCIYITSKVELYSGLPNIHQFQYKDKENKIDYNYCSELQFWKNLLNGESTINADVVLFTDYYRNKLEICRTYRTIKAYLGFAKRDLKLEVRKKVIHAARSLYCAESLINNEIPKLEEIQKIYDNILVYKDLIEKEKSLRIVVNELFDKNLINNYYIEDCEISLWGKMLQSNNNKEFRY